MFEVDITIRVLLGMMLVLFFFIRAYHYRKAQAQRGPSETREPNAGLLSVIRNIGAVIMLGAMAAFFFWPALIAWAAIPLPEWARWAGLAIGTVSLPLIWWTEASLGLNFDVTLHVRERHTLVTHGPYRWVRHPMYTGLFLMTSGWLLASANWLVGLPGLLGLIVIVINRLDREEQVMIETFGEEYRAYMRRTGRLLPRVIR